MFLFDFLYFFPFLVHIQPMIIRSKIVTIAEK